MEVGDCGVEGGCEEERYNFAVKSVIVHLNKVFEKLVANL